MKLMVIDGNSILNRAFYGVRALSTRDGTPTNAVLGFLNMLQRFLGEENPDALCVTFDLKGPTFRHERYDGYKAQRKGMPDELAVQLPIMKEVLEGLNIPWYALTGWEADDLIGTIARLDTAAGWETVVVTGDRDSLQLIDNSVTVKLVRTHTAENITPAVFRERYGFEPIHIVDLKALMGDSSDNIPGVKGIGEKTAMGLIQVYHSIDVIYDQLPDILQAPDTPAKPGVIKKLTEGEPDARMSFDLATIRTNAPIDFTPEANLRKAPNQDKLYPLFLKLEFARLIEKFGLTRPGEAVGENETKHSFMEVDTSEIVETNERAEELLALWRNLEEVNVLLPLSLDAACVVYRTDEGESQGALLLAHRLEGYDDALRVLCSAEIRKATHDVKSLTRALLSQGFPADGFVFDTALAAYLLAPTDGSYDLEKLGMSYLRCEPPKAALYLAEGAFGPFAGNLDEAQRAILSHTALLGDLRDELTRRLKDLGMWELYTTVELPLCPVLARMEMQGVLVDRTALADFGEALSERIEQLQTAIYETAGEEFNINSTQQLGRLLFERLGLPREKKTKTGYSTSAEVLEKLRGQHEIIDLLLEYRQLTKLNSTYVEGLGKVIAPDGRIHTYFQNTVTATGRLSSAEPNLQNIPVRTELGARLRYMFVAPEGWKLVDADYSQIELRLLAHIAGDETMREAFLSGTDIHTATASQVFGVPPQAVTHEMRRRAKAVNFGIVYGISDFSLARDIGVTRWEAKEYMEKYFATFRGVRAYMDRVKEEAKEQGYVSTLMGRRRWLPELKSSNFNTRSFGERVALNMPIQGTAADIMKLAMIRVDSAIRAKGLKAKLILQVHDELIVECPDEETEEVKQLLTREMEGVVSYSVPLRADSVAGKSWGDTKN